MPNAELGGSGLICSKVGFGGYRISNESENHQAALESALLSGVNLIDTSANYTDGNSEKLIGDTLERLVKNKQLNREEMIVVTKAGYIQGQNWDRYESQLEAGSGFPEVWKVDNGLAHSIHPLFLADQLNRSLNRLKLSTIDIFLLHNPEYYFSYCQKNQIDPFEAKNNFYEQISKAFIYLESEVKSGRIRCFGISSNHFSYPADHPEFVSLDLILEIAKSVDAKHFKVVQMPVNLIESGAFVEENQADDLTVMKLAQKSQLGVLVNRPLNAMVENRLIRLSTFNENSEVIEVGSASWHRLISDIALDEQLLSDSLSDDSEIEAIKPKLLSCLQVLNPILDQMPKFESVEEWDAALFGYFLPRLEYGISIYQRSLNDPVLGESQIDGLVTHLQQLFIILTEFYRRRSNADRQPILNYVLDYLPQDWHCLNGLSAVAIRLLTDSPGVSCVLVGMRDVTYVAHVLTAVQESVSDPSEYVWQNLGSISTIIDA